MARWIGWVLVCTLGIAALAAAAQAAETAAPPAMKWMWVFAPTNFQVDKNADDLIALMARSKKAGYNGMLVGDWKWGQMKDRPPNYFTNMERVRKAAADIGMDIIPSVYSSSLLINNPNLAEGVAVKDCVFAVKGKQATVADTTELLPGGGFEQDGGRKFPGWDWADECAARDTTVKHSGAASLRMEKFGVGVQHANGRIVKKLTLKPWTAYHLSLWIKTQDLAGAREFHVSPLVKGMCLCHTNLRVKSTQDWTEHHVVFNSLENTEVSVYVGIWGGSKGTLWLDDLSLKETAGVNLLRRDGCPLKVTSEDGRTEYAEGKDFEKWEDPKMGRVPWPGSYEVWHAAPPLVLTDGSRIKDGAKLRVSFYHVEIVYDDEVFCCLRHPEVFQYFETQIRELKAYFGPKKYFLSHDEIRLAGQCGLCRKPGETTGQVLAENVRRCAETIRKVEPQAEIFVWSDMFDPNHNAVDQYYLCGSSLKGSWEGLAKDVRIAAWLFSSREKSLPFFTERGHKVLMAGYYDDTEHLKENVDAWLGAAAKVKGVEGIMYTQWGSGYGALEKFADAVRAASK